MEIIKLYKKSIESNELNKKTTSKQNKLHTKNFIDKKLKHDNNINDFNDHQIHEFILENKQTIKKIINDYIENDMKCNSIKNKKGKFILFKNHVKTIIFCLFCQPLH
jgi:hypothetical protein